MNNRVEKSLKKEQRNPSPPNPLPLPGYYQLKEPLLFISNKKITYTYRHEHEVVSLHFDIKLEELFFQGHRLQNLPLTPDMRLQIEQFRTALSQSETGHKYLRLFDASLRRILSHTT